MGRRPNPRTTGDTSQTKTALHQHIRQMLMLERLCSRFHLVAVQLRSRYGDRATLDVQDEHDLRDLLHALLILEHDDVRPLEWTPGHAGGIPQVDFFLGLEQVVVVAKIARSDLGAGALAEQLAADVAQYQHRPDCKTLFCFIYDPEGRIANPRRVESELGGDRGRLTVRVIIAPREL